MTGNVSSITSRLAPMVRARGIPCLLLLTIIALILAGCGSNTAAPVSSGHKLRVVAAENFWGSIAWQEAGHRADVTSIIVNPNADPHAYESTASDARLIATANLFIYNGVGYDGWAPKLASANPVSGRRILNASAGLRTLGTNPHIWYSPRLVLQVANRITHDYRSVDPKHSGLFERLHHHFVTVSLGEYHHEIHLIRGRFQGARVGATESIFEYMAPALGLHLISPPGFMKDLSEGTEPTAGDKRIFDNQIAHGKIKVLVYNIQNSTPDVKALVDAARAHHIPVVPITETLDPAGATFQAWQTGQLKALAVGLHKATGR